MYKIISLLWMGSLLGAGCAFIAQVILARYLSVNEFGIFSASLATITLLLPLAGFGISQFWLKIFGKEGWSATRWLPVSFNFITLSTLLVFMLILLWAVAGPNEPEMKYSLVILSLYIFGQVSIELISSKLQLEENYVKLAFWQLLPHFSRLFLLIIVFYIFGIELNIFVVSIIYAGVSIVFSLIGAVELQKMRKGQFNLKGHENISTSLTKKPLKIKDLFSEIWAFGLAGLFHLVYFQSDIILVKYMSGSEAAGNYNVAFTIMVAVYILPSVIYQKFLLPKMHRWANHDKKKFYDMFKKGNIIMLFIGIIAMLFIWISAKYFIPLFFGEKYILAVDLLLILSLSIPVTFVASSVGATLVTKEHMKHKVKIMGIIAVFNIVLNIILIPKYSAEGAAIATVISNLLLLIFYYLSALKIVFNQEQIKGIK